jgi:hypothetical protein
MSARSHLAWRGFSTKFSTRLIGESQKISGERRQHIARRARMADTPKFVGTT